MTVYAEGYLICNTEIKEKILKEKKDFKNYIFLSKEELLEKLTFHISKKAYFKVMKKYGFSYAFTKECLQKLYYIEDQKYHDVKLDSLVSIYHYLKQESLLEHDPLFPIRLKQYPVTFIDFASSKEIDFLKRKIEPITSVYETTYHQGEIVPTVYDFKTIKEECVYVFTEIKKLLLAGISLNQIVIFNADEQYQFLFHRLAKSFGISLEIPPVKNISNAPYIKEFLTYCDQKDDFTQILSLMDSQNEWYIPLVRLLNDYGLIEEKPTACKDFLLQIFQTMTYPKRKYVEAVRLFNHLVPLSAHEYGFFVGFQLGSAPMIQQEAGFLNDAILTKLGCSTSYELNQQAQEKLINVITNTKHLTITFKHWLGTDQYFPSVIIQKLQLPIVQPKIEYGYAPLEDILRLTSEYDDYLKYGELTADLQKYGLNEIPYRQYQHHYQGMDQALLNQRFMQHPLKLAYSSVKLYFACPFSFFADRILGLNEFEPQMAARMGTFSHAVLEDSYNEDFNFDASVTTHKIENCEDAKDEFFFDQMVSVLRNLIAFNQEYEAKNQLKNVRREEHIVITKENYIFEGYIDKLMYRIDKDHVYAAIIDYKTGKDVVSLDNIEDGFHLQLPSYMYLLSQYEPFKGLKLHIIGIYLQKVNIVLFDKKSDIASQMNKKFRLEGYTVQDIALIRLLDPYFEQSTYIKSMGMGKDGFRSYAKVYPPKRQDEMIKMVENLLDNASKGIHDGVFPIAPKLINGKNESCQFCKYKDLCFMDYKDLVELEYKPFAKESE